MMQLCRCVAEMYMYVQVNAVTWVPDMKLAHLSSSRRGMFDIVFVFRTLSGHALFIEEKVCAQRKESSLLVFLQLSTDRPE